jgi:hypothetical protein
MQQTRFQKRSQSSSAEQSQKTEAIAVKRLWKKRKQRDHTRRRIETD